MKFMRLIFFGSVLAMGTVRAVAANPELAGEWKVFFNVVPPESFASVPSTMSGVAGNQVKPQSVRLVNDSINLGGLVGGIFKTKDCAVIFKEFQCDKNGILRLGFAADYWFEIYLNGKCLQKERDNGTNKFTANNLIIDLPVKTGRNVLAVKVLAGTKGWMLICGKPTIKTVVYKAGSDWKVVDMSSIVVRENSALDLSSFLSDAPAGKYGRAIVGTGGFLAFENQPDRPIRLTGYGDSLAMWIIPKVRNKVPEAEWKKEARLFAKAMRLQGYNLIRILSFEKNLCYQSTKPMSINPKILDMYDYILAELKKEGVYCQLTILAYGLYSDMDGFERIFQDRNIHKIKMYFGGEWERERFRYGAETLLNHVNPYTGMAWKDDPVFVTLEFYNEQEILLHQLLVSTPELRALVEHRWREWLKNKYPNGIPAALKDALEGKTLAKAPVPDYRGAARKKKGNGALENEFLFFLRDMGKESFRWCEKTVREIGYKGLILNYNSSLQLNDSAIRWECSPIVEMHSYHAYPRQNMEKGSTVDPSSAIEKLGHYWRNGAGANLLGRPFGIGEFNHCFWNPWQHECGLLFGAYSALNGFDFLIFFGGAVAVQLHPTERMENFSGRNNPVARAGQFLLACLYGRGDVAEAKNTIAITVPGTYLDRNMNCYGGLSGERSKLSLLGKLGLIFPDLPIAHGIPALKIKPSMVLPPENSAVDASAWTSSVRDDNTGSTFLPRTIEQMKRDGLLPKSNLTDPAREIFQSDTGEILMCGKEKLLKVVTPKTEAVSMLAGRAEKLDRLTVDNSSVPACIAVCSMDGRKLANSRRIVLIYNTMTANTGMELSEDHAILLNAGRLPVLMQCGKLEISLRSTAATKFSLYALGVDGARREKLQLEKNGELHGIKLDTATLKNGPTPFFELVAE